MRGICRVALVLLVVLLAGVAPGQSLLRSDPFSEVHWVSSLEQGCPPPELTCVYYATGDCMPCGPSKTAICDSYICNPNGALYTCCVCGIGVC